MTAQVPERLIIDGKPRAIGGEPLYRLLASRRISLRHESPFYVTACHRGYRGTWQLSEGRLYLAHLNLIADEELPFPPELLGKVLRAIPAPALPAFADWFNGEIRMPLGPVLIDSFHGLGDSWFQRMRVLRFKAGVLVRDRVVDTHKMIEWWFRRHPETRDRFGSPSEFGGGPEGTIAWFDASEDEDWGADGDEGFQERHQRRVGGCSVADSSCSVSSKSSAASSIPSLVAQALSVPYREIS